MEITKIRNHAEEAVGPEHAAIFDAHLLVLDDPEFRAADIKDVSKRVLAHMLGKELPDPSKIDTPVVIVAEDLTPSDTAQLDKNFVKGFVTNVGGRTSHSAIMSRSLEIPAVVGTKEITAVAKVGDDIIVDGSAGEVIV